MLNPTPPKNGTSVAATPTKRESTNSGPPTGPSKKKFQNGWTREIEVMLADWADQAVCYRWMHEKTERIYHSKDMSFAFPVIILSTITGAANFALDSVIENPEHKKYAQLGLGGLSILTGIISTIATRLGYASGSEAHRGAALLWGKFQRIIAIELSLHPDERSDCMTLLKTCRSELDRLIEQSPTIPDDIIKACQKEFEKYPTVHKPDIVGDIDTTHIFVDTESRLKQIAKDAAITIAQKKGVLKQIVLDDLEPRIAKVLAESSLPTMREDLKKEVQRAAEKATKEAIAAVAAGRVTATTATAAAGGVLGAGTGTKSAAAVATAAERAEEMQKVAASGVVRAMREKLATAKSQTVDPPKGIGMALTGLRQSPSAAAPESDSIILHVADDAVITPKVPLAVLEEEEDSSDIEAPVPDISGGRKL